MRKFYKPLDFIIQDKCDTLPEIKDKCWMEKRTSVTGMNTAAVLRGLVQCSRDEILEGEE